MTLSVGIETSLLANPRTGIGNYSLQLLISLAESNSDLHFDGFTARKLSLTGWSNIDIAALRTFEKAPAPLTSGKSSPRAALKQHALALAKKSYAVRAFYRHMQGAIFERTTRSRNIDFFHALNFIPPGSIDLPVLPIVYDLSFLRFPGTHPAERLRWLDRLPDIIARAPFVHTISEFSKREIAETYSYPGERIVVAPPAAAPAFHTQPRPVTDAALSKLELAYDRYFLAVGTLEPRKNLKTLIEAYAALDKAKRIATPLAIVGGDGWGDLELPQASRALLQEGSLRFLGRIPDDVLRSLYAGTRALLFPSIYEGFGMPVVEAMQCGAPVIHSGDTAMDEISGTLGIRVVASDVDQWSRAIKDASDSDWRKAFPVDALVAQANCYNWATSAARVRAIYDRMPRD